MLAPRGTAFFRSSKADYARFARNKKPIDEVIAARMPRHFYRADDAGRHEGGVMPQINVRAARPEIPWERYAQPSSSDGSKTMTDEDLATMHRLLAEYHRNLAREAMLDVVQHYHADLAQRFADEAAQIPRRTATLERLRELEKKALSTNDVRA